MSNPPHYGATALDWMIFADLLGLRADLLPVVSNPHGVIDPSSSLTTLGKVPSVYTRAGTVVGIPDWTTKSASADGVAKWALNPDYGICLQTRHVRAIDVDIPDVDESACVRAALAHLGLPTRSRSDSAKFLLAFELSGVHAKRDMRTSTGLIEFLANGQQFIAAGTHPDGCRYEWEGGAPYAIPTLSLEQFDDVWAMLSTTFATATPTVGKVTTRVEKARGAAPNDEVAVKLIDDGWVLAYQRSGALDIRCPFADTHTGASADSATTYFPAHTGGYATGNFKCLHAHCAAKTQEDFRSGVGITPPDMFSDESETIVTDNVAVATRFAVRSLEEFSQGAAQPWLIKGVLPEAEFAMIYGPPSSGKTFFALDMVFAIARDDVSWRGLRTQHGRCVYIAAEDAGGVRSRVRAYATHHGISLDSANLGIISDAPNLLNAADVAALATQINAQVTPVKLIVVDTLTASILGGSENDTQDMGKLISHCKKLRELTGGMVLLVHHTGKDGAKAERGSSVFRGASDCSIEIARDGDARCATVVKQKNGNDSLNVVHGFALAVVDIGVDEDGDPITSCACVATAAPVKQVEIDVEKSVLIVVGKGDDKGVYIKDLELLIPGVTARKIKTAVAALKLVGRVTDDGGMVKLCL